jgi:phenylacetate-CoA ligase
VLFLNLSQLLRLLALRRRIRTHDRWTREDLKRHQDKELKVLRDYACTNSPFYREFHKDLTERPIEELPVLTKAMLMENWDEIVTDRSLKLSDIQDFIKTMKEVNRFNGKYFVSSTAGSSGLRGIFVYDQKEWTTVLASYARANDWAGVKAGLTKRLKVAVVSTTTPWHQSAVVGATLNSRFVETLRIDSTNSIESIVERLNAFQPRSLIAYAGMARSLAQEQIEGRLKISPEAIFTASEVLTDDTRNLIMKAWKRDPINVFATTETAGIASECMMHHGLHVYEDLVILEAVDENNVAVKPGNFSEKILVTVLFSRTIPLIRYELSDSVLLAGDGPKCDLPFNTLVEVQGRMEEVITMDGTDGTAVRIHPNFFHNHMEAFPVKGWQIVQEPGNKIRVFIMGPSGDFSESDLADKISDLLVGQGVQRPEVNIERVEKLTRSSLGKTFLIKALPPKH